VEAAAAAAYGTTREAAWSSIAATVAWVAAAAAKCRAVEWAAAAAAVSAWVSAVARAAAASEWFVGAICTLRRCSRWRGCSRQL